MINYKNLRRIYPLNNPTFLIVNSLFIWGYFYAQSFLVWTLNREVFYWGFLIVFDLLALWMVGVFSPKSEEERKI